LASLHVMVILNGILLLQLFLSFSYFCGVFSSWIFINVLVVNFMEYLYVLSPPLLASRLLDINPQDRDQWYQSTSYTWNESQPDDQAYPAHVQFQAPPHMGLESSLCSTQLQQSHTYLNWPDPLLGGLGISTIGSHGCFTTPCSHPGRLIS
jgi:hypothetical protein